MVELVAQLTLGMDPSGPVHDGAIAGTTKMRGHLFGPLVGRAHGMGPADGVMVVSLDTSELVDPFAQVVGRFQVTESLQGDHLIEGALQRSFSRGTIVTENIIN